MIATKSYELRCPIHQTIEFGSQEKAVIDHPLFQRLRYVSQLGFAHYVYPGATHSRFSHCIGAMNLASHLFDHLLQNASWLHDAFSPKQLSYFRHILRLAALCHDLGHPPFSHSAETALPPFKNLEFPLHLEHQKEQATHEDFSMMVVCSMATGKHAPLSQQEAYDICALIGGKSFQSLHSFMPQNADQPHIFPLLKNLISGEIDCDRMDYLLRDAYYSGVSYGKFDLERLMRSLSCVEHEGVVNLALLDKGLHAYENFLFARWHMFLQVYLHKTTLPFDYYLTRVLQEKETEFVIDGSLSNFLNAREDYLNGELWKMRKKHWAGRIINRHTLKFLTQGNEQETKQPLEILQQNGIDATCLKASGYFSRLERNKTQERIVLQKKSYGTFKIEPLIDALSSLKYEPPQMNLSYIYCEPEQYNEACQILKSLR